MPVVITSVPVPAAPCCPLLPILSHDIPFYSTTCLLILVPLYCPLLPFFPSTGPQCPLLHLSPIPATRPWCHIRYLAASHYTHCYPLLPLAPCYCPCFLLLPIKCCPMLYCAVPYCHLLYFTAHTTPTDPCHPLHLMVIAVPYCPLVTGAIVE